MVKYQVRTKSDLYYIIRVDNDHIYDTVCVTTNKAIALSLLDLLVQKEGLDVQEGKSRDPNYKPWRC